uniref:Leuk-A4-hydro_C domain-containing protein n=1 Tax=Panagrellus redivivus TaxID=6233 RepID=A0A7E4VDD0_PANRE
MGFNPLFNRYEIWTKSNTTSATRKCVTDMSVSNITAGFFKWYSLSDHVEQKSRAIGKGILMSHRIRLIQMHEKKHSLHGRVVRCGKQNVTTRPRQTCPGLEDVRGNAVHNDVADGRRRGFRVHEVPEAKVLIPREIAPLDKTLDGLIGFIDDGVCESWCICWGGLEKSTFGIGEGVLYFGINVLRDEHVIVVAEQLHPFGITEHVDPEVQHAFSDAERALLKAAPADAPRFANAVVNEADKAIERFVKGRNLAWNEDFGFWDFVNTESTPASIGYIVMYRIASHIFKLKEVSMADTMVQTMPLMGLYILLLDKQFPTTFRINLATELRSRASRVFKNVQRDQLKNAAFPATYMILAYDKNPKAFVKGEEIHSEAKKRRRRHHRHHH